MNQERGMSLKVHSYIIILYEDVIKTVSLYEMQLAMHESRHIHG